MKLKLLNCDRCRVSDLSPLTGTCLTSLAIHNTQVSDLSPLQGMSLTTLHLEGSAVTDLSPLKEMPLENLSCDFDASRDAGAEAPEAERRINRASRSSHRDGP